MINKLCQFRPCHFGLTEKEEEGFDCDGCFCPLYPCGNEEKGHWLNQFVWDCSDCIVPHQKNFMKNYRKLIKIMQN
jgi:Zn-finger protein